MTESKRTELLNFILEDDVEKKSYEYHYFYNFIAKKKKFVNINFRYSVIDFSYFHKAEFIDCDFTGVVFKNCNFRSAKFERCNFDYSTFSRTVIPYSQLLKNLPKMENIRLSFIKNIRVNAEEIGERDILQRLVLAEVDTQKIHFKKAFIHNDSYYLKYEGWERITSFFQYLNLSIRKLIWNHGYSYFRIILFAFCAILVVSLVTSVKIIDFNMSFLSVLNHFLFILSEALSVFVDIPNLDVQYFGTTSTIVLISMRYVFIGLVINVFYMKNIKK